MDVYDVLHQLIDAVFFGERADLAGPAHDAVDAHRQAAATAPARKEKT